MVLAPLMLILYFSECPFKKTYAGKPVSDPEAAILTNGKVASKVMSEVPEKDTESVGGKYLSLFYTVCLLMPIDTCLSDSSLNLR